MACCAAIALVISLVRGVWFRIAPGARPVEAAFAPPARRPLGGAASRSAAAPVRRRRLSPSVLLGVAAGVLGYALVVAALLLTGLARARGTDLWVPRDVTLVALAGTATAFGVRGAKLEVAPALLGAGIAWSELGLVDMHVLRLFTFPHIGVALDLLFHGAGFLLVLLTLPRVLTPSAKAAAA